eukprot:1838267-Amphidinium_carterae.1
MSWPFSPKTSMTARCRQTAQYAPMPICRLGWFPCFGEDAQNSMACGEDAAASAREYLEEHGLLRCA